MSNKGNIGNADRIIRIYTGIFFTLSFSLGQIPGVPGLVLFIVANFLLVTGIIGRCPLYKLTGLHTNRRLSDSH